MSKESVLGVFEKFGTDKGWLHHYENFYAFVTPPESVLEIGVWLGASLQAWRELWPQSRIVGVDINPECNEVPGCELVIGDITKMSVSGPFDLIIDDGSHIPSDQKDAYENLIDELVAGGLYVIEDVTEEAMKFLQTELPGWNIVQTGDGFDDRILWRRGW